MEARDLHLRDLVPSRNIREDIDITELTESVREHGVLQPIRVRPVGQKRYQIIAGHRRVHASRAAGRSTIPAIIADESDESAAVQTIVENLQRENLSPLELSRGIRELQTSHGLPTEAIGRAISKSPTQVRSYIRLSRLPDDVLDLLESGEGRTHSVRGLTGRHVRGLIRNIPVESDSPQLQGEALIAANRIRDLRRELDLRGKRINAHQADEISKVISLGELGMSDAVDHVLENPERFRYQTPAVSSSAEVEAKSATAYESLQRELATTISKLRPEIASAFTAPQKQRLLEMLTPSIERLLRYQGTLRGETSQQEVAQQELLPAPE